MAKNTVVSTSTADSKEDVVFVSNFRVLPIELLPGSDTEGASISLLQTQAALLMQKAKAITDKVKEAILPYLDKIRSYGEGAGKHDGQTDDEYCASQFHVTLGDGTQVSILKSVVFGKTAVAMVQYLITGGLHLAKFEQFTLSNVILKKSEATTNAGKGEAFKAVVDNGDECIISVQSAGTDAGGNLKGWFEVLALAAKAVYVQQDELKALRYLDGMAGKTGLSKDALQAIVQLIVDATVAREMRKLAKSFSDKATEASHKRWEARRDAEKLEQLTKVAVAAGAGTATRNLPQAH